MDKLGTTISDRRCGKSGFGVHQTDNNLNPWLGDPYTAPSPVPKGYRKEGGRIVIDVPKQVEVAEKIKAASIPPVAQVKIAPTPTEYSVPPRKISSNTSNKTVEFNHGVASLSQDKLDAIKRFNADSGRTFCKG